MQTLRNAKKIKYKVTLIQLQILTSFYYKEMLTIHYLNWNRSWNFDDLIHPNISGIVLAYREANADLKRMEPSKVRVRLVHSDRCGDKIASQFKQMTKRTRFTRMNIGGESSLMCYSRTTASIYITRIL